MGKCPRSPYAAKGRAGSALQSCTFGENGLELPSPALLRCARSGLLLAPVAAEGQLDGVSDFCATTGTLSLCYTS